MLEQLLASGYGIKERYNCAEKMLFGANEAYGLGMSRQHLLTASCFGGGMAVGGTCGVISGALMVLGLLTVKDHAHEGTLSQQVAASYIQAFRKAYKADQCAVLKPVYTVPDRSCESMIITGGRILDTVIQQYGLLDKK